MAASVAWQEGKYALDFDAEAGEFGALSDASQPEASVVKRSDHKGNDMERRRAASQQHQAAPSSGDAPSSRRAARRAEAMREAPQRQASCSLARVASASLIEALRV